MSALNRRMSDAHEKHLAEVFSGRQTRGSGNQWRDQTDVRQSHRERAIAFALDGKSTRARSISIKLDDLDKLREQAHAERPMLPIRFYEDDRLRIFEDWDLLREDDVIELTDLAELASILRDALEKIVCDPHGHPGDGPGLPYPDEQCPVCSVAKPVLRGV